MEKSRRDFLNRSMLTAAGALGVASSAAAATTAGPAIRVPDAIPAALKSPSKAATFPMSGAQVFARACKEEGLAALFCCPGNYAVINAIAAEGIPCFGGRTKGRWRRGRRLHPRHRRGGRLLRHRRPRLHQHDHGYRRGQRRAHAAAGAGQQHDDRRWRTREAGIQPGYQQPTTEGMRKYGKRLIDPDARARVRRPTRSAS